jgi:hypothetical protein
MDARKHQEVPIPLPPEKVAEVRPLPKKRFFKNLSPRTIAAREGVGDGGSRMPRGVWWGVAGLLVLFIAGFTVSFFVVRRNVSNAISSGAVSLRDGMTDLENLNPSEASQEFSSLTGGAEGLAPFAKWLGFLFQGGMGTITAFTDTAKQLTALSQELAALESDAVGFLSGRSADIISHLTSLRATLASINTDSNALSSASSLFGGTFMDENAYLSLQAQSAGAQKFLDALIPWLSSPVPHHVLVMLQNPSEIRPAGGFLGSYADIGIASGTITDISVHDIADVDTAFTQKIVPPKPLQLEVSRLRPADANWFFDFPTSASETLAFFNQSKLYAASTTAAVGATTPAPYFDAAIAVSPSVVSDLLKITGPITVSSTKTTFTSDNFLVQVQKIVQAGQASSATYPKQVLRDLMAGLSAHLASSPDVEKQGIAQAAANWIADKDLMIYADDSGMESFLKMSGAGGDVYVLPQNFNGDYLAVVDANINGGKSDLSVAEKISWTSQIGADGTTTDNLIIDRKHNGNTSPYWWYQTQNQVYLQVFVPEDSLLTNEDGGLRETISPKVNYAASGYSTDPLIAGIESGTRTLFSYPAVTLHQEDGKEVFATWSVVKAGASAELSFDYTHHAFVSPAAGVSYEFVFEKQAGTNRDYSFEVDAPLGYQFTETGLPSWTYESSDPPGRMIVDLTLEKTTSTD